MIATLVTGATGFLGTHLVAALHARGYAIRALVLPAEDTTQLEREGVEVYRGDVREPKTLVQPMRHVDTVFHLAGVHGLWRPKQDYYSINVVGTEHVCRAALAAGVRRLIHVSSWVVYGMGLGRPVDESFPLRPLSDTYAMTKAKSDEAVQRFIAQEHLPGVVIRPTTIFGPGDRVNLKRMADRLKAGKVVIIGFGRNAIPFVYVSDIVDGLLLAASQECAAGQIYNLANDRPLTQEQFWRALAEEIGAKPPRLHVPYHPLYALACLAERAVSSHAPRRQPLVTRLGVKLFGSDNRIVVDKARRELAYEPRVSLREGIRLGASWYLRQATSLATDPSAAIGMPEGI